MNGGLRTRGRQENAVAPDLRRGSCAERQARPRWKSSASGPRRCLSGTHSRSAVEKRTTRGRVKEESAWRNTFQRALYCGCMASPNLMMALLGVRCTPTVRAVGRPDDVTLSLRQCSEFRCRRKHIRQSPLSCLGVLAPLQAQAGQDRVHPLVAVGVRQRRAVHLAREHQVLSNCRYIHLRQMFCRLQGAGERRRGKETNATSRQSLCGGFPVSPNEKV